MIDSLFGDHSYTVKLGGKEQIGAKYLQIQKTYLQNSREILPRSSLESCNYVPFLSLKMMVKSGL